MSLELLSVNIERSRHLDRVAAFVAAHAPDVLCIQELVESDIPRILEAYPGAQYTYVPMLRHLSMPGHPIVGIGIFSRITVTAKHAEYYFGSEASLREHGDTPDRGDTMNCAVAWFDVEKEGAAYSIGTTHFTWSEEGQATDLQRQNMRALLAVLEKKGEFVLCGDLNAPRGREIFGMLAARYKDNIPPEYTTSIDASLHRAGDLQLMVDGLFSTPGYKVRDVTLHTGVSDHCAITASIERV